MMNDLSMMSLTHNNIPRVVNIYELIAVGLIPYLLLSDGELLFLSAARKYLVLVKVLILLDVSECLDGFLLPLFRHLLLANRLEDL